MDEEITYHYGVYITNKKADVLLTLCNIISSKEIDDQILCNKKTNLKIDVLHLLLESGSNWAIANKVGTAQKLQKAGMTLQEFQDVLWGIVKANQVLKLQQKLKEKNKIQKIQERKAAKTAREIESIESQLIEMGESLKN